MSDIVSGVGVLDKAVRVLDAVTARPCSLADLTAATGLSRPTAHRLAVALEKHRLVGRDGAGRFTVGARFGGDRPDLAALAAPMLRSLRDQTGESAQLYVRRGDERVCVATADRGSGLRDTVPEGMALPLTAGSGGQVLLAWADDAARLLAGAAFTSRTLAAVRRRGWAASVAEREAGVASVSAPVWSGDAVVAALCVSGPIERLTRTPGRRYGAPVVAAATELGRVIGA